MPFGVKTLFLSNKEELDIPNLLRLNRHKEIIDMYMNKLVLDETLELKLPESTMYKILKECTASRTKAVTCVDYFLVEAIEVKK